jgi:polyisoprenoid-binding protein YceI
MLVATAFLALAFCASTVRAADTYKIDPVHSFVIFHISHFNIGHVYGRFNAPEGTIQYDPNDPSKCSFDLTIKAANVDTGTPKRDDDLRSEHFFDVKKFPTITFKSTSVRSAGKDKYEVTGDLTLHGVTKTITVPITKLGEGDTKVMGYRTGWESHVTLKRSDYNMHYDAGLVGDDVHLTFALEARKS